MQNNECKLKSVNYIHFDYQIGIKEALNIVTDKTRVSTHGFYPFIAYDKYFVKIKKHKQEIITKVKTRPICYASHIDRFIYQYYAKILNDAYNKYIKKHFFDDVPIAYRTDLKKNNIHFSKEAFDFIVKEDCNILVGDFKGFFDNIGHEILKKNICKILNISKLQNDFYKVFKSITNYSSIDLMNILIYKKIINKNEMNQIVRIISDIEKNPINNKKTPLLRKKLEILDKKIKKFNQFNIEYGESFDKRIMKIKEFKTFKSNIVKNTKKYGIPQGSPISAILSNIFMIDFDLEINNYVRSKNGLFLRYSDDFIIVVPKKVCCSDILKKVEEVCESYKISDGSTPTLILQEEKTQLFSFSNGEIIGNNNTKFIDYLGFTFDGKEVKLREKTISKYYYRMNRKIKTIVRSNGKTKKGRTISHSNLYKQYSRKGRNRPCGNGNKRNGNFLTYLYRATAIFSSSNYDIRYMNKMKDSHLVKIRRNLQYGNRRRKHEIKV